MTFCQGLDTRLYCPIYRGYLTNWQLLFLPELGHYRNCLVCSPVFPFPACEQTLKSALEKSLPGQAKELNTLQEEHSKYMNAALSEFQGL